jgi:hypothetical protein
MVQDMLGKMTEGLTPEEFKTFGLSVGSVQWLVGSG